MNGLGALELMILTHGQSATNWIFNRKSAPMGGIGAAVILTEDVVLGRSQKRDPINNLMVSQKYTEFIKNFLGPNASLAESDKTLSEPKQFVTAKKIEPNSMLTPAKMFPTDVAEAAQLNARDPRTTTSQNAEEKPAIVVHEQT